MSGIKRRGGYSCEVGHRPGGGWFDDDSRGDDRVAGKASQVASDHSGGDRTAA